MKRKLAVFLSMLMIISSLPFLSYADDIGCKTESKTICVKTGKKDKDGKDIEECHMEYQTRCVDKIIGTLYFTKDINGNVYDMNGNKVGENGRINVDLDINAIEKSQKASGVFDPRLDYAKRNVDSIELKTFKDAFNNSSEYDKAYGYKTNKSLTYDDYKKNFSGKGMENISMSNTSVDKTTGKVKATISGTFPKDGTGLKLDRYKNDQQALKDYMGKVPDSLKKQIEYMNKDATVQRELVMIPYSVEVKTSYKRTEEIIPPAPTNPKKPAGHIIIDDVIGCPSYLTWSEIDHDKVETQEKYYTDSNGKDYSYTKVEWVPHTYKYRIDFKTDVTITDAKGRDLKTNTIKSGYGYKIKTKTSYKVSGGNGRAYTLDLNIKEAEKAYEQHDFNMTHIYKTQPKVNYLVSNGSFSYKTPINPLSKTNTDVIYTDRDMADGKHKIYVELKNITVAGRHLCTKNIEEITIKGNMYEDYTVN